MRCRYCGNEVSGNDTFCDRCGREINGEPAEEKKFCANCGAELDAKAVRCGVCGEWTDGRATESGDDVAFCGNCGARVPAGTRVCPACGANIYEGDDDGPPDRKVKRINGKIIAVIIVCVTVLLAAAAFTGYAIYSGWSGTGEADEKASQAPSATQSVPPTPSVGAGVVVTSRPVASEAAVYDNLQLSTYYVVNCKSFVSLRETPSTSAKVIREVSLGEPVSYVEPVQNGFAKVIYNGHTGYILQAYLSDTPPESNNSTGGGNSGSSGTNGGSSGTKSGDAGGKEDTGNNGSSDSKYTGCTDTDGGASAAPSYSTYTDKDFNFRCDYPTNFILYNEDNNFVRYSLKSSDGAAILKICATNNPTKRTDKIVSDNFKSTYPGVVDYEELGTDWCAVRTHDNGTCHYGYFKLTNGMIRGFEFHFPESSFELYDSYVNSIYKSLSFD